MMKSFCYRYRNKTLLTRILSPAIMLTWMAVGRRSIIMDANAWIPTRSSHIYNTVSLRRFSSSTPDRDPLSKPQNIAIVGGGLAGLSTAYHLLQKSPDAKITIFDKDAPGCGGASAVAGGLLHPLSPKGKLVYLGLEGLSSTNRLVDAASQFRDCVMRSDIHRIATSKDHVTILMETANSLPNLAEWLRPEELKWDESSNDVLGALRLHSGCMVVHMPSYLEGLWEAIQAAGTETKSWYILEASTSDDPQYWHKLLNQFDAVILSAGSGLFQDAILKQKLPIQLVRGQSVEMTHKGNDDYAMLCGKYVSPLPHPNRVLIGATHEFKDVPLDRQEVVSELRARTHAFASHLWENGTIDKVTCGYRVQSNRGKHGRLPIVGKIDVAFHSNAWIYTGLSSRGLLYHGIFGEILANRVLQLPVDVDFHDSHLDWWKQQKS